MTIKKALSLVLALVMILSCMTVFASCKKEKTVPMSKRTHVYSETPLDPGEDFNIGYVSNIFTDGENVILNYPTTYTRVLDENFNEVERFDGYYFCYEDGVYEPIEPPILYDDLLSSSAPVVYGTIEDEFDIETEEEFEAEVDAEVLAVDGPIDIMPVPGPQDEDYEIEGEPDEFGVITDENHNIKVPEGWHIEYTSVETFAEVPLNGGESKKINIAVDELMDLGEEVYGYISGISMGSDGNVKLIYEASKYDEETYISYNKYYILTLDLDTGDVTDTKLLNDCFAAANIPEADTYIYNIILGTDGYAYFTLDGGDIYVADENMKFVRKLNAGDGYISEFSSVGDKILISMFDQTYTKQTYKILENGALRDIDTAGALDSYVYGVIGAEGDRIYFMQELGVFYLDLATGEVGEELNFINSDIDYLNLNRLIYLEDGKMLSATTKWTMADEETTLAILTRVPEEEIKEEIIVTVGSILPDYTLVENIMAYNKQNNGTRISVKTYDQYNNAENEWTGARTQMNNEIVSGALPDIVCLTSELPSRSYFQKGVFTDLNKYIDDKEVGLDRSAYLDNVFRANEMNGKLYSLIASFGLYSLAAKSKYVGNEPGWTFEDFMAVLNKLPADTNAFYGIGRDEVIRLILTNSMNSLVNWETGETKFDTPEFIDFIKYMAKCPEKGPWQEYYDSMPEGEYIYDEEKELEITENMQLRFWNDTAIFYDSYLSSFNSIPNIYSNFASKDVTLIGFPTSEDDKSGAVVNPNSEYAISSKSKVKDQAWDFIKFMLNNETDTMWSFSTNRALLDKMKKRDLELSSENLIGMYIEDYEWMKEMGYSDEYIEFMRNMNAPFDEEMADTVYGMLESTKTIARSDDELIDIINEELSAFFAGTKSAEETARIIAGRAKTFIGERS